MTVRALVALDRCPECDALQDPPNKVCCCKRCGHDLDEHTASLDCRICKLKCGIDCTLSMRR